MTRRKMVMSDVKNEYVSFQGGLDTVASAMFQLPGAVIGSENYEPVVDGGYARLGGYERYDGHPRPSAAELTMLAAQTTFGAVAVGSAVSGAASAATGVVCYADATIIALTKVTGTWAFNDIVMQGATLIGVSTGEPPLSALQLNEYLAAAENEYRDDIAAVPGAGPIRGIGVLNDIVYALRDNVGQTAQAVWKSTAAGWVAVPLPLQVSFTVGSGTPPAEGAVITQGAVTATVRRVVVESGDFVDSDAAGRFIITGVGGGNFTAGALTAGGTATISGIQSQISLSPGGRWDFKRYNFYGSAGTQRLYGCDGVNSIAEFDGTYWVPIVVAGMSAPAQTIEVHRSHLWAAFGASLQHSSLGTPYSWDAVTGAGELGIGDHITCLQSIAGESSEAAMLVLAKNRTGILYGKTAADFTCDTLSTEVGCKAYSAQSSIATCIALDDQGMRSYAPTQSFGNLSYETLTDHLRDELKGIVPTASVVDKDKGRYRLFLNDGRVLSGIAGSRKRRWSWLWCRYPFTVNVATEGEVDGVSRVFMAGDDGHVYECGNIAAFDGAEVEAWIKLAYGHMKSPGLVKTFDRFDVEVKPGSAGVLSYAPDFDFGDSDLEAVPAVDVELPPPATLYDIGRWDRGAWDGKYVTTLRLDGGGDCENASMSFYTGSATEMPHELRGATIHFIPRRRTR